MMASPLALRTPTCLACLRRTIQPARSPVLTQLRGKKTRSKLVVQLTEDIPGWGPRGNIIRISRESMRVTWYPTGKMRYVTPEEFKKLKYKEDDITNRNRSFGMEATEEVHEEDDFYDPLAEDMARLEQSSPGLLAEVEQLEPRRALELLDQFIPATLTFERRLVHPHSPVTTTPTPGEPTASEEEAAAATTTTTSPTPTPEAEAGAAAAAEANSSAQDAAEARRRQQGALAEEARKIHGSVSTLHVAQQIREMMFLDPEAARIQLAPEDVTFVSGSGGEDDGSNSSSSKVDKIGTYEVEIRAHAGKIKLNPVWRTIEVVPVREEEEAAAAAAAATTSA